MTEAEKEMFAQITAANTAHRYMFAALIFTLGESKAVDVDRTLAFVEVLASALRQPYGVTDPTALRTMALAAEEMERLRPSMVSMATMPPGAGRA